MDSFMNGRLSSIKLLALDFDGVFTDNKVYVNERGEEAVRCDRGDSLGIALIKKNYPDIFLCVISKEKNPVVQHRCKKLDIQVFYGIDDKVSLLKKIVREKGLIMDDVGYMGNDMNDLECIMIAGLGIAVADSFPVVLKAADYVTTHKGGDGAIREIIDMIMEQQQKNANLVRS